ncbi:MAG: hypothetical protein ACRDOI_21085 [Trebonia sp.]
MIQLRHKQLTVDGTSIHAVTAGPAGAPAHPHGVTLELIQLVPPRTGRPGEQS